MGLTHITKRRDFKAAAESGLRFRCPAFSVQMRRRDAVPAEMTVMPVLPAGVRLGLTASRHTGTATERNRIRRRLRAAAEQSYGALPDLSLDIVIVARRDVLTTRFDRLKSELARALTHGRPPRSASPDPLSATVRSRSRHP